MRWGAITDAVTRDRLKNALAPLVGAEILYLQLPIEAAEAFEPSQVGTVIGTLTDAVLPYVALNRKVGLTKGPGILGSREGYPDFDHEAGYRLELKGLFRENPHVKLKKPPTPREPSARLTQKVTLKNVKPNEDGLLLLAYELRPSRLDANLVVPVIVDLEVLPVIDCVLARDKRLISAGGRWFGNYETPAVLSKIGREKLRANKPLDISTYGRKESEGRDYNEDTNFGKLKRIPYQPLQEFLKRNGAFYGDEA